MQDVAKLIAQHLQNHSDADALESATGGTGTCSREHAAAQNNPCEVRPLTGIVVKQACGGDKRHHLKQGAAEGALKIVVERVHQHAHDGDGRDGDNPQVQAKL